MTIDDHAESRARLSRVEAADRLRTAIIARTLPRTR